MELFIQDTKLAACEERQRPSTQKRIWKITQAERPPHISPEGRLLYAGAIASDTDPVSLSSKLSKTQSKRGPRSIAELESDNLDGATRLRPCRVKRYIAAPVPLAPSEVVEAIVAGQCWAINARDFLHPFFQHLAPTLSLTEFDSKRIRVSRNDYIAYKKHTFGVEHPNSVGTTQTLGVEMAHQYRKATVWQVIRLEDFPSMGITQTILIQAILVKIRGKWMCVAMEKMFGEGVDACVPLSGFAQ